MADATTTDLADATQSESVSIELRDVRKEFDDVVAVEGVSLEVESGELLVLLGPSGCGKTTTLRMIAGLEVPTSGQVVIGGTDVTGFHPRERDLSMVFQSYALYPHKNVYENLEFPLNKMELTEAERDERIHEVAELLEIADLLDKKPKQLSGGQRQRVAVGRTMVRNPSVFLMDEPLSNLDAKLRVTARSEIRALQQRLGTTTVYVTHDQEEAMSIADRIAIMNDGELVQVGPPEEVYTDPANEFVAGFVGEPAMNFLAVDPIPDGLVLADDGESASVGVDAPASTVTLGVRPEDIYLATDAGQDPASGSEPTTWTVDVREPQGHADELTLSRDGLRVTAWVRQCPDSVTEGADVEVTIDLENVHLFDADGEVVG
jgi:multiple sugar transport system ATP-binding protein